MYIIFLFEKILCVLIHVVISDRSKYLADVMSTTVDYPDLRKVRVWRCDECCPAIGHHRCLLRWHDASVVPWGWGFMSRVWKLIKLIIIILLLLFLVKIRCMRGHTYNYEWVLHLCIQNTKESQLVGYMYWKNGAYKCWCFSKNKLETCW
jgi:hypothetical protein